MSRAVSNRAADLTRIKINLLKSGAGEALPVRVREIEHFIVGDRQGDHKVIGQLKHHLNEPDLVQIDQAGRIIDDDARHSIFTTPHKFDVITTDPIHPWVKGTSTLYSKQYYELVKSHLNAGGVVAQWLPIYDSDAETVKSADNEFPFGHQMIAQREEQIVQLRLRRMGKVVGLAEVAGH